MNTFIPYPDFDKSVQCLDYRRLGKQRVEALQVLRAIHGSGWRHHSCTKMWTGYEGALAIYMNACIIEWLRRGYRNTMRLAQVDRAVLPPWFGNNRVHASHRSNLLRKFPEYYSQFGWTEPHDLPYVWPSQQPQISENSGICRWVNSHGSDLIAEIRLNKHFAGYATLQELIQPGT